MTGDDPKVLPLRPRRCPMCGKPTVEEWRPFCSKRCADLDLARWLGEDYRIPAVEDEESKEEAPGREDD